MLHPQTLCTRPPSTCHGHPRRSDEAGGGKVYRPVYHALAIDSSGAAQAAALRAGWLPWVTNGRFFKADSYFAIARNPDRAARNAAAEALDFLSHSHGEGFLRFFIERMSRPGIFFLDEPESALSPRRQLDLLRLLHGIQSTARAQVIMATHSPLLMALPGARVYELTRHGIAQTTYRRSAHFKLLQAFTEDPETFVAAALCDQADGIS